MERNAFRKLVDYTRANGLLKDTAGVAVEEQVMRSSPCLLDGSFDNASRTNALLLCVQLVVFAGLLVRGEVFSIDYRERMGEERR